MAPFFKLKLSNQRIKKGFSTSEKAWIKHRPDQTLKGSLSSLMLLHSKGPKLYGVLAILSAKALKVGRVDGGERGLKRSICCSSALFPTFVLHNT